MRRNRPGRVGGRLPGSRHSECKGPEVGIKVASSRRQGGATARAVGEAGRGGQGLDHEAFCCVGPLILFPVAGQALTDGLKRSFGRQSLPCRQNKNRRHGCVCETQALLARVSAGDAGVCLATRLLGGRGPDLQHVPAAVVKTLPPCPDLSYQRDVTGGGSGRDTHSAVSRSTCAVWVQLTAMSSRAQMTDTRS